MSEKANAGAQGAGQTGFGGTKDRDSRDTQKGGQMHAAAVVANEETGLGQMSHEFMEVGLTAEIETPGDALG